MKTVAALDIGTNSVRLLVGRVGGDSESPKLQTLLRRMTITRLGEGLQERGSLSKTAMERTLKVIADYRREAQRWGAEKILPVATSATREADNGQLFVEMVREVLGVNPCVIDGRVEAWLSFWGATYDLDKVPRGREVMVFDLGGGSTELVRGKRGGWPEWWMSLPLGCVRVSEKYKVSDPPKPEELEAMERGVDEVLRNVLGGFSLGSRSWAVGLAGTVTTLSGLRQNLRRYDAQRIHHSWLSLRDCEALYRRLSSMGLEERRSFMEIDPARAEVIVGGAAVLVVLMRVLGLKSILVSEKDILDGTALAAAGVGPNPFVEGVRDSKD